MVKARKLILFVLFIYVIRHAEKIYHCTTQVFSFLRGNRGTLMDMQQVSKTLIKVYFLLIPNLTYIKPIQYLWVPTKIEKKYIGKELKYSKFIGKLSKKKQWILNVTNILSRYTK